MLSTFDDSPNSALRIMLLYYMCSMDSINKSDALETVSSILSAEANAVEVWFT